MNTQRIDQVIRTMSLASCVVLALSTTTRADVTATVHVPNGTTSAGGFVSWTLAKPGQLPIPFSSEIGSNVNASQIALTMELESDGVSGIDTGSAGNTYFAIDVGGTMGTSPAEVDVQWEVTSDPGNPVPHPNYPLTNHPPPAPWPSMSLFIAGVDGTPVPARASALLEIEIVLNGAVVCQWVPVYPKQSTDEINKLLDESLQGCRLPRGVEYIGRINGFPTFIAERGFRSFSVRIQAMSDESPGFNVGYLYQDAASAKR